MFSRDLLRDLYRHMEWADARMWAAMPTSDAPLDDRLRETLVHIHLVQRAFLCVWTKHPVEEAFRKPEEFATLADVRAWAQPYYVDAHAFIGALNEAVLDEPVVMPWAAELEAQLGRPPSTTTLGDTCFQVTSHTTHHRGQVCTRLRGLGVEPPPVDYIGWVWFGKPAPEWK
jgi:uncharacterized damage-inducible protein DinB